MEPNSLRRLSVRLVEDWSHRTHSQDEDPYDCRRSLGNKYRHYHTPADGMSLCRPQSRRGCNHRNLYDYDQSANDGDRQSQFPGDESVRSRKHITGLTCLIALSLRVLPCLVTAQTLLGSSEVNGMPIKQGETIASGSSGTSYLHGHSASVMLPNQLPYDYVILVDPRTFTLDGYSIALGADMRQCIYRGDAGFIMRRISDLLRSNIVTTSWGTGGT